VLAPDPIFAAIKAHRVAWGHLEDNPSKKKVHTTPNSKDGTTPSWMRQWPALNVPLTRTRIAHGDRLDGHVEEGCTKRIHVRPARSNFSNALNFCRSAIAALVRSP
jgi:hypothetical protein